jgi:hypothetical protein
MPNVDDLMDMVPDGSGNTPESESPKGKTGSLPGMESPTIPELTKAAEEYAEARDTRMANGKLEKEKKVALIQLMHKHDLTSYRDTNQDPPVEVELVTEEKVKVRIKDDEEDDDE